MTEKIIKLINIDDPTLNDKLQLLEELYWANWEELDEQYPNDVDKVFLYLKSNDLGIKEMAKVLSLYSNIDGAYTDKFAKIIANLYMKDKIKFFKTLNLNKGEAINLVYIFRNLEVFDDEENEYNDIESTNQLSIEELDTASTFFSMYKNICNT